MFTALTHEAAAGNPHAYVQAKAGHSQSTITDRYIHAAQVLFPGAPRRPKRACSGPRGSETGSKTPRRPFRNEKRPAFAGLSSSGGGI